MANINGIIYYKLDAETKGYVGDITKNCGLKGEEIDGNFNFLRGHDIETISFDESGNMLITRYNGEVLKAIKAPEPEKPDYAFAFDSKKGSLTIITPNGKEIILDGFKTASDIDTNVFHDFTLEGTGIETNPLKLSNIIKTGRYKPAIKLIDTTVTNEEGESLNSLPKDKNAKNDRYVTKEKVSRFGKLYPLTGIREIQKRLEEINSEWRIPSKEEWDELLNAVECANPNHNSENTNVYLGEVAGTILKSTKYWKEYNGKLLSQDAYGFSIYPVGYAGNRGVDFYGSFGESCAYWTLTDEHCLNHPDVYVKIFDYKEERVGQQTWGEDYHLSLRLVKNYNPNEGCNSAEDIDGVTVNCLHIPGQNLIWTKDNIAFSKEQYLGFTPKEWEAQLGDESYDIRYYINDWNGKTWDRHEILEGEGIVIYETEHGRMHEWLLVNGELIDSTIFNRNEFEKEFNQIENNINHLQNDINLETQTREENDKIIESNLNLEKQERENADIILQENINAEQERAEEKENEIISDYTAKINAEQNRAIEKEDEIISDYTARINAEQERAEEKEDEIISDYTAKINAEQNRAIEKENELLTAINVEQNRAIEKEDEIISDYTAKINAEQNRAEEKENELLTAINAEQERAEEKENELLTAINAEQERAEEKETSLLKSIEDEVVRAETKETEILNLVNSENAARDLRDNDLQKQINENRIESENDSIVVVVGNTENNITIPTTIKVNLNSKCEHLKLDEEGIYFDGYFGQF